MNPTHFLKIFFPTKCISCGIYGNRLCIKCKDRVIPVDFPICLICENLSIDGTTHIACKKQYHHNTVDKFNSLYIYNKTTKTILNRSKSGSHAYKYLDVIMDMELILQNIYPQLHYIIPIPATNQNRLVDQSKYISRKISIYLKIPTLEILKIHRHNRQIQQKGLSRENRFKNTTNKYTVDRHLEKLVENKKVLLVDDVCTTGATILSCSSMLKNHGVKEVQAFTLLKDFRQIDRT